MTGRGGKMGLRGYLALAAVVAVLAFAGKHHVPHLLGEVAVVVVGVIALRWALRGRGRAVSGQQRPRIPGLLIDGQSLRGEVFSLTVSRSPARARAVAIGLERDLTRVCARASALPAGHLDVRQLNGAAATAHRVNRAFSRTDGTFSAADAASARRLAADLARLSRHVSQDRVLAGDPNGRALASWFGAASSAARELERHVTSTRTAAQAARRQAQDLDQARARRDTAARPKSETRVRPKRRPGDVIPAAGRMIELAARLLPAPHRARYLEEFLGELREIAETKSRHAQFLHAVRLLAGTPALRMNLRSRNRRRGLDW